MPCDRGSGPLIVVIPGIQGRWEWMEPALDVLRAGCRVITFSLAASRRRGAFDPRPGSTNYVEQLDDVLERHGVERAAICGVSFGGLIALRYAATRPDGSAALILVSAPPPGVDADERQQRYLSASVAVAPVFVAGRRPAVARDRGGAAARGRRGRVRAAPRAPDRGRASRSAAHGARCALQQRSTRRPTAPGLRAPTLVVTGEADLDRVVPPAVTRATPALIPGARYETLARTGHLGLLTRPTGSSQLVCDFVHAHDH